MPTLLVSPGASKTPAVANPDDLELGIRRAGLTQEGLDLVAAIRRRNGPVVDVPKGAVHGFYMSSKMRRTCRFASRTAELVHLASLDQPRNPATEFYEQPCFFEQVRYRKPDALRDSVATEIPDALVIEQLLVEGVHAVLLRFVEVKKWDEMVKLAKAQPWRYFLDDQDRWHDLVLERYCAERYGIPHQIWTEREVPRVLYENWGYVEDYVIHPIEVPAAVRSEAKKMARTHPGDFLSELYKRVPQLTADFVNQLFADRTLFGNLHEAHLKDRGKLRVFADDVIADVLIHGSPSRPVNRGRFSIQVGSGFKWGEALWRIGTTDGSAVVLVTPDGRDHMKVEREMLERLFFKGEIQGLPEAPPTAAGYLAHKSDAAGLRTRVKLGRLEAIRSGASRPRNSTEREWLREAVQAELDGLPWFAAVKPKFHLIGQQKRRVPEICVELALKVLEDYYLKNIADGGLSMRDTYEQYRRLAHEKGTRMIARGTLRSILEATWSGEDIARARMGSRAANQAELRQPLGSEPPPHGDRPHGREQIDHSTIDIFFVDPLSGETISERATLTLIRDAYSGRIMAYALRYGTPSMESLHLVIRDYVRRWRRMPSVFVCDNAFGSNFFVELCATFGTRIDIRPVDKARYGGPIEEGIGRVMEFCHKLRGNTVVLRKPREMDRRFDPRDRAVWTIETFETEVLQPFLFDKFDNEPLRVAGVSPRELYEDGIRLTGERPNAWIDPDEPEFMAWSALPPRRGTKIHDRLKVERDGFSIVGIPYWSDLFAENGVVGSYVRVREEPEDIGIAYAWRNGRWNVCETDRFPGLKDLPRPLRALASKEIRIRLGRDKVVTPEMTQFIADLKERERVLAHPATATSIRPLLKLVSGDDAVVPNAPASPESKAALALPRLRREDVPDLDDEGQ